MNSQEIVTKTTEIIQIGDKSVNIYVYNGNEEKPLLFLIRDINDAVYGSPKNNVNMFYKANGKKGEFIWKFNKKWQLYQSSEVDCQSTSKPVKEDHIFFTEDGLYECLGYATLPHAKQFQKQLRILLREIRSNKLGLKINDKSSVFGQLSKQGQLHGVMKFMTNQQSDLQPLLSHEEFKQSIENLIHNDKILKISEREEELEQLEEESKSNEDKCNYLQMLRQLSKYKQQIQKQLDTLTNQELQKQLEAERQERMKLEEVVQQEQKAKIETAEQLKQKEQELEQLKKQKSKFTGSIYKETINVDAILEHCYKYQDHQNETGIKLYKEQFLDRIASKSYIGQGSDPDPFHRPKAHQKNRKELFQMIKAEPKYAMQIVDYIQLVENLPEGIPKFDLEIFIKAEILETDIEITDKDTDDTIPKKLRTTKLTERERHYFQQYRDDWTKNYKNGDVKYSFQTWNTIQFDGALTLEECEQMIKEEEEKQFKLRSDREGMIQKIKQIENEIKRLQEYLSNPSHNQTKLTSDIAKKQKQISKYQEDLNKKDKKLTTSIGRQSSYSQQRNSIIAVQTNLQLATKPVITFQSDQEQKIPPKLPRIEEDKNDDQQINNKPYKKRNATIAKQPQINNNDQSIQLTNLNKTYKCDNCDMMFGSLSWLTRHNNSNKCQQI